MGYRDNGIFGFNRVIFINRTKCIFVVPNCTVWPDMVHEFNRYSMGCVYTVHILVQIYNPSHHLLRLWLATPEPEAG